MVVKPNERVWQRVLARVRVPPPSGEEWRETYEHGTFTIKRYPHFGTSFYDKNTATIHLFRGDIPERLSYHELIHRAQSNSPELKKAYEQFKGGSWGRAKNANAADYYGSVIEQMAHAGGDVEWQHLRGCPKRFLETNCQNKELFQLPKPDPAVCFIPNGYDHSKHEEAYFQFVKEYIDLLREDLPIT